MSSPLFGEKRVLPASILAPVSEPGLPSVLVDGIITTDPLPTPSPVPSSNLLFDSSSLSLIATTSTTTSTSLSPPPTTPTIITNTTTNSTVSVSIKSLQTQASQLSLGAWLGIGLSLGVLLALCTVYTCLWIRKRDLTQQKSLEEPKVEIRGRLGREARVVAGGTATRGFEVTRRGGGGERMEAEARQIKRVVGARKVVVGDGSAKKSGQGDKERENGRGYGKGDGGRRKYTHSLVDGIRKDQIGLALGGEEKEKWEAGR